MIENESWVHRRAKTGLGAVWYEQGKKWELRELGHRLHDAREGKYAIAGIVSHTFPREKIDEAFRTAEWMARKSGSQVRRAIVAPQEA